MLRDNAEETEGVTISSSHLNLFLLTSVATSALWASVPFLKPPIFLALLVWMLILARWNFDQRESAGPIAPGSRVAAFAILAPTFFYLLATLNQEFPFVGDHDYHLVQAEKAAALWTSAWLPVAGVLAWLFWRASRRHPRQDAWLAAAAFGALIVASYFVSGDRYFSARYPGGFYFLAAPLVKLFAAVDASSPLDALRLVNFLSIPAWLFVLRPVFLRRAPSWEVALAALALFFLQKDVVYYFSSSYLEPWGLILCLTAAELVLDSRAANRLYALPLCGLAMLLKEHTAFAFPFLAWALLPGARERARWSVYVTTVVTSVLPFAIYARLRELTGIQRTVNLATLETGFDPARLLELGHRLQTQFSWALLALPFALVLLAAWANRRPDPVARRAARSILGALLFATIFFHFDRLAISHGYTGYPRYYLLPYTLFLALGLGLARELREQGRERALRLGLAVLITLQSLVFLPHLWRAATLPAQAGNFSEHYDAPIYFPVRELLTPARSQGYVRDGSTLEVLTDIRFYAGDYTLQWLAKAYPRETRGLLLRHQDYPPTHCRCAPESPAVLGLFVTPAGLRPASASLVDLRACRDSLRETCQHFLEVERDGQITGLFGSGVIP